MSRIYGVVLACILLGVVPSARAGNITLAALQDANIADGDLADMALGDMSYLMTNWSCDPTTCTPPATSRGLIQFDLSAYSGMIVGGSTLELYQDNNTADGKVFDLFRNTSPWDESTVTFNTAPAFDLTPVSTLAIGSNGAPGVYRAFDVTTIVQQWLDGTYPNYGLTLIEENEVPANWIYLVSKEGPIDQAPQLILDAPQIPGVPEPATMVLMGGGLVLLARLRRRR